MNTAEQKPINQLHETEPRWFVVRTRSKSEKFAQRLLQRKNITAWVPIQSLVRRYSRSTRKVEKPLISCYVFVQITKGEYVTVLETENVLGFIKFAESLYSIPQFEIDILKRITLEADLEVDVVVGTYKEGDPVEISAGNLIGLRGKIVKVEGKRKMQVALEQLGLDLLITVDIAFLAPLNGEFRH
jgi:transcription antitermination factor NusG